MNNAKKTLQEQRFGLNERQNEFIFLTPKAQEKILEIAKEQKINPLVRAVIIGGGCSGYRYDLYFENENDITDKDYKITFGKVTLVIDMLSMSYLEGTTIDYVDTFSGAGFKFMNDKYKNTCGCGRSFSA